MKILDIGCGNNKMKGAIGIDRVALPEVDIVHDLNSFPYPFEDNTFDEIYAAHIVEHLDSIIRVMEELHRIASQMRKSLSSLRTTQIFSRGMIPHTNGI